MKQCHVRYRNASGELRWTDAMILANEVDPLTRVTGFVRQNAVRVEETMIGRDDTYNPALGCYMLSVSPPGWIDLWLFSRR